MDHPGRDRLKTATVRRAEVATFLSTRFPPQPESRGVELNVERGTLKRVEIDAWNLKSAW